METNNTNTSTTNTTMSKAASVTSSTATATATTAATAAPVKTVNTAEELCGSENILDTIHLKNLVEDLAKLYSTSVCTKVARDTKAAAEKRLIEAIRANLERYNG